jgi:hypothetical protein
VAAKTNGAEFKAYLDDDSVWPANQWHEDEEVFVNGKLSAGDYLAIPDEAVVEIHGGYIEKPNRGSEEVVSLEDHFTAWQAAQTSETIVVSIPKSKAADVRAAITAAGGVIK